MLSAILNMTKNSINPTNPTNPSNLSNLSNNQSNQSNSTNPTNSTNPAKKIVAYIMVKNESNNIIKTLSSVENLIDDVCLLDTGSTDDTLEKAKEYCIKKNKHLSVIVKRFDIDEKGNPKPFDFRESRNYGLRHFDKQYQNNWCILLDANDEVKNADKLKKVFHENKLDGKPLDNVIGFHVKQCWNYSDKVDEYTNIKIIRLNSGWYYGATIIHEAILNNKYDISKPSWEKAQIDVVPYLNIEFYQDRSEDNEKSKKRFARDKEALYSEYLKLKDVQTEDDFMYGRVLFYLAQTCLCLGDHIEAFQYYRMRAKFERIFIEERYHSLMNCGSLSRNLGHDYEETIMWYTRAFECIPRIEPLITISSVYYQHFLNSLVMQNSVKFASDNCKAKLILSDMYCKQALIFNMPTNMTLFVNKKMYEYTRWKMFLMIGIAMEEHGMISTEIISRIELFTNKFNYPLKSTEDKTEDNMIIEVCNKLLAKYKSNLKN